MSSTVGNKLHWKWTPESLHQETDTLISKARSSFDAIGSVSLTDVTFENVLSVKDI